MDIEILHPVRPPVPFPFYGDELLSVLALAVASVAVGRTELSGVPDTAELRLLADALVQMGVPLRRDGTTVVVNGVGRYGLHPPAAPLQVGESGLVLRVLAGLAAGTEGETVLEAQGQLARRTLVRMIEPLAEMGVHVASTYKHTPPLHVFGIAPVQPLHLDFPLPNFYLKLPLLLAALFADEPSVITEPSASVSHLEHLLTCADVREQDGRVRVEIAPQDIEPFGRDTVPMDAAVADVLLAVAALSGEPVACRSVPVNPTRGSLLAWLREYSTSLTVVRTGHWNNEVGDVHLSTPVELPERIVLAGGETRRFQSALPVIAVLCAGLPVELEVRDALDLRQNRCDRIAALVDGLAGFGADVEERDDGFLVRGSGNLHGAGVACYDDESIALAMLAAAVVVGDATALYDLPDTPRLRHCLAACGIAAPGL